MNESATTATIWKKLTPSQRVTLLDEAGHSHYGYGEEALHCAGLKKRSHLIPTLISGTARHALGRKGLLDVGRTVAAPATAAGFHTPRKVTAIGRAVAEHGMAILRTPPLREGGTVHAKKKRLSKTDAIEAVRRIMRSTGFDEEEVYGGEADQLHFASREEGDVLEGRPDPGTVRWARDKAKEIEAAVPGAKARVETVDEWVSINVELPSGKKSARQLKVGDAVEVPDDLGGVLVGTIARIFNEGTPSESAEVRVDRYAPSFHPTRTLKKTRRRPSPAAPPPSLPAASAASPQARRTLRPGDEVKYTNFTVGGSYEGKAVVTWDHGKSVEARTLGGEKIRLERASDGSLRRFT